MEEVKSPVILPDGFKQGGGVLGAITTITGNAAGGEDQSSTGRKSELLRKMLLKWGAFYLLIANFFC